jgi:hypothetical protein
VLSHPFFADLNFEALVGKQLVAPFKPDLDADHIDVKFFNAKNSA